MIFKHVFFHLLAAFSTFIELLWTAINVHFQISFLNSGTTLQRALDFKFSYYLLQAHIWLKSRRQRFLAARAGSGSQIPKALLANNSTTLFTIKRRVRQIETADALKLVC